MKRICIIIGFCLAANIYAQLQQYGLENKVITSLAAEELDYNSIPSAYDLLLAGTDSSGVYLCTPSEQSAQWNSLGLTDKYIQSLTVQHWGVAAIDGLAAYAGISRKDGTEDTTRIYKREVHLNGIIYKWIPADSGIRKSENYISALNAFYFSGHTPPGTLFAGSYPGLYMGINSFWTKKNLDTYITSIDVYPHWYGGLVWAVGSYGLGASGLRSTDGGQTWKNFYIPSPADGGATSICINTRYPDSLYVAVNGEVYVSPDSGNTFNLVYFGTNGRIKTVALDPLHPENIYAAGSNFNSLYFISSKDGGKTWDEIFPNMLPIYIAEATSMTIVNNHDVTSVFLGTNGSGVWKYTPEKTTDIKDNPNNPSGFRLYPNYPNPFNPSTTIIYSIPVTSKVELKIFDILGKEISTLVNEMQSAGKHSIIFNASTLPGGVYFCNLKSGNYSSSQKLILLK